MSETSDIVTPIIKRLELLGYAPERRNAGVVGARRVRVGVAGTPDIHVTIGGRCVWLECKLPKTGRLSDVQVKRHAELKRGGAVVEVVRSVDEAMVVVNQVLTQNETARNAVSAAPGQMPATKSEEDRRRDAR